MNTIEYCVVDLSKIKFRLDFICELNILTLSDKALPLCEFNYYKLNERLLETVKTPKKYNRVLSFNRKIDNYSLTKDPETKEFDLHINASKAVNNFYTGRVGKLVGNEDYYKIHTDIKNVKLISQMPQLPSLATSRYSFNDAERATYLRFYLNDVAVPSSNSNFENFSNWLNITLLRFSESRYERRVRKLIDNYRLPNTEETQKEDLALHQWKGGLLDSEDVYDYLTKLPLEDTSLLCIQIKGYNHSPSAWSTYKDFRRFHSHTETPTQSIFFLNGKFLVCDEYSVNRFKR